MAVDPRVRRQVALMQLQLDPRAAKEALGARRDQTVASRDLELALAARGARALADVRAVPYRDEREYARACSFECRGSRTCPCVGAHLPSM